MVLCGRFPGWKRPGLIEADLVRPAEGLPALPYFRGGNAPASLKLLYLVHGGGAYGQFPGWKRPGLIEAYLPDHFGRNRRPISGVETPRPH